MRRERLHLSPHQFIETGRDFNGRFWIGYSSGASRLFRDAKDLRRFLKLPQGIPSRASFDSWIASLTDAGDAADVAPSAESSFDPLVHALDESDPNHNARTVI